MRARFSIPVQTGAVAHPGAVSFPGIKRTGRGVNRLLSSSVEVKEIVEL
jgi:hypothetical protein